MAEAQDSHITGSHKAPKAPREDIKGPVPKHHRNALGQEIVHDPQGVGEPSRVSTIANGGKKGW